MAQIELIVIGASAGGLEAISDIVGRLPADLDVAILIAVHTGAEATSYLPEILARRTKLPVAFANNTGKIEPNQIYIAPPNYHLTVEEGRMCLSHGPKENGFRPAVDPLFRTAARVYGNRVMGVILSGALDDGTYGLKMIKDAGGVTVVQDPEQATHPGMPSSALRFVDVDYVLPTEDIAKLIASSTNGGLAAMAGPRRPAPKKKQEPEPQHQSEETNVEEMEETFGAPSGLTCPDCGGALWRLQNGALTRFRCHVGHQFTTEGLDAQQQKAVEEALWSAVRILEERAQLRKDMAERAEEAGARMVSNSFHQTARVSAEQADTIRGLLFARTTPERPAPAQIHRKPLKATRAKARRKAG